MIPSFNNAVAQTPRCSDVFLNFAGLSMGDDINDINTLAQLADNGIAITSVMARNPVNTPFQNTVFIYDSFGNARDPDLEHEFQNNDPIPPGGDWPSIGNMPVIPEDDVDPNRPSTMSDWPQGGTIEYTFDDLRILKSFMAVDDLDRTSEIRLFDSFDVQITSIPIDQNADNFNDKVFRYDDDQFTDVSDVKRMEVFYPSSGAITNFELGCVRTSVCDDLPPTDTSGIPENEVLFTVCIEDDRIPEGGTIKIVKDFLPGENPQAFTFRFTPIGMNPQTFELDDDSRTPLPNSKVFDVQPGFFEIIESPSVVIPSNSLGESSTNSDEDDEDDNEIKLIGLNDIDCIGDVQSKITKDGNKVKIEFIGSDNIVCTFFNSACTQGIALLRFEYLGTPQPVDITYLQNSNLQDTFLGVGIGDMNDVVPLGNDVKLSSTTDFEIRDPTTGALLDTITKHTSCSQPIFVGETLQGNNVLAELKITVLNFVGVPTIPGTEADTATTQQNTPVTIDVLSNDFSVLYITSVETPTQNGGSAVINQDNTITYTPAHNFVGTDSFVYQVQYNEEEYDSAAVSVTVTSGDNHERDNEDSDSDDSENEDNYSLDIEEVESTSSEYISRILEQISKYDYLDNETKDRLSKLQQKSVRLDERLQSLFEKYEDGKYYGLIPEGDKVTKSYSLSLDGSAFSIHDDSTEADFSGEIFIETLSTGTDYLKFRVTGGQLIIGDISYDIIFGKARTTFTTGDKDSTVILAQLLDEEGNSNTLRISFESTVSLQDEPSEPINFEISQRSKIAHNWHLSASGQLSILEP